MKATWILTPLFLIALAAGSYGVFLYLSPKPLPPDVLYGNGHIEGTEVDVGAEVSGRIAQSAMIEGREIRKGDLLIKIDDSDFKTRLAQAQAEETAANKEKVRIEEELRTARHHVETAKSDLARYSELKDRGNATPQRVDQAENVFEQAQGQVKSLEAGSTEAGAKLDAARQAVRLIQSQLEKTEIRAPIDATILAKGVESGEFVTPGKTIAALVDLSRLELKVFIPERDVGKVKLGLPARVRIDAFADRYFDASVERIDQQAQFTPREIHMPEERVRMVFGVTLALANSGGLLKPGMPADAWILWQDGAAWPGPLAVPR